MQERCNVHDIKERASGVSQQPFCRSKSPTSHRERPTLIVSLRVNNQKEKKKSKEKRRSDKGIRTGRASQLTRYGEARLDSRTTLAYIIKSKSRPKSRWPRIYFQAKLRWPKFFLVPTRYFSVTTSTAHLTTVLYPPLLFERCTLRSPPSSPSCLLNPSRPTSSSLPSSPSSPTRSSPSFMRTTCLSSSPLSPLISWNT